MVRRDRLVTAGYVVSVAIGFVGVIVIASGNARPYVDPTTLPFGAPTLILLFALLLVGGGVATSRVSAREWDRTCSAVGLRTEGDESYPPYTGSRRGYPIRVRRFQLETPGSSSATAAVTVVEVTLSDRLSHGLLVQTGPDPPIEPFVPGENATHRGDVSVASDDSAFARSVADAVELEVVTAPERLGQVYAGETPRLVRTLDHPRLHGTVEQALARSLARDGSGSGVEEIRAELGPAGGLLRDDIEGLATDDATVVGVTEGLVLDTTELDRQIDCVVAVAAAIDGRTRTGSDA